MTTAAPTRITTVLAMTGTTNRRRHRRLVSLSPLILLSVLFCISTVMALRFIPPMTSGLMIERRLESLANPLPYTRRYSWTPISNISPHLGKAVLAAEDQRFLEHDGFDWEAIRAAASWNKQHTKTGRLRGASTLSQQTAKNLFLWSGRSWLRKALEAGFTVLLELCWSKHRILEVYLNIVEFGDGIYGAEAAAQHFFGKHALQLTAQECALLAAVLPNPRVYQVSRPSVYTRSRQAWILRNMNRIRLPKR